MLICITTPGFDDDVPRETFGDLMNATSSDLSSLLKAELAKALARLSDQTSTVEATRAIIASHLALPSLKKIAEKRLPKLLDTLELTAKVVDELNDCIKSVTLSQTDIESVAPPKELVKSPRSR